MDGISCHGNVNGLEVRHVSVALVSAYGLAYYRDADGHGGDGLWMSRCMFQRTGKSAVHRPVSDANIHNVHIQFAGHLAGAADGHAFFTTPASSGNMTYVGCRADLCAASGCCFEGDGMNHGAGGEFVGIRVRGQNRVFVDGTTVMVNKLDVPAGAPKYSLGINETGSAPGPSPEA